MICVIRMCASKPASQSPPSGMSCAGSGQFAPALKLVPPGFGVELTTRTMRGPIGASAIGLAASSSTAPCTCVDVSPDDPLSYETSRAAGAQEQVAPPSVVDESM